ncbi:unnamed protein product, partial [Staurois parvus]
IFSENKCRNSSLLNNFLSPPLTHLWEPSLSSALYTPPNIAPYREYTVKQGRTDHWGTRALPEGPGSVWGNMRCFFGCGLSVGEDTGAL